MLDSKAVRTKIFADGADLDVISRFARDPRIKGFTTNPTLMRKAGVADYASFVSVFAGRIADTGRDPIPVIKQALDLLRPLPRAELIWASPRELLNVIQASETGCHVITATAEILAKLPLIGKDLTEYSLETVKMFYQDALAAGYQFRLKSKIASAKP